MTATGNLASLGANTFTGSQTFVSSQTFDGRDVSVDGAKLDGIETGATADQTNAEIRSAVEAASDSNVFTDADHTKLNAIEANATADQTAAEIRTLVESATDSNSNLGGSLGPCMIYDRELTAGEVLQNYNSMKARFGL